MKETSNNNPIRIEAFAGKETVVIESIVFRCKRKIDWPGVEQYLKRFIGNEYVLGKSKEKVRIGSDFPDEYANSSYTKSIHGTTAKAKANAAQAIPLLIQSAEQAVFRENLKDKHKSDANEGWYYCVVRFTLPVMNDSGVIIGTNCFRGRMILRKNDGKLYLYDIIDIKKGT